eukprot:COSAG06_NODE_2505_length_6750_cov_3.393926_8_plen_72_part_00
MHCRTLLCCAPQSVTGEDRAGGRPPAAAPLRAAEVRQTARRGPPLPATQRAATEPPIGSVQGSTRRHIWPQ